MYYLTTPLITLGRKMTDFNLEEYFTSDQVKPNSTIWRWNLNNTPTEPSKRILIMAQLIQHCQTLNQKVMVKPDRRLRAKGLCVVFANTRTLED